MSPQTELGPRRETTNILIRKSWFGLSAARCNLIWNSFVTCGWLQQPDFSPLFYYYLWACFPALILLICVCCPNSAFAAAGSLYFSSIFESRGIAKPITTGAHFESRRFRYTCLLVTNDIPRMSVAGGSPATRSVRLLPYLGCRGFILVLTKATNSRVLPLAMNNLSCLLKAPVAHARFSCQS